MCGLLRYSVSGELVEMYAVWKMMLTAVFILTNRLLNVRLYSQRSVAFCLTFAFFVMLLDAVLTCSFVCCCVVVLPLYHAITMLLASFDITLCCACRYSC